MAVNLIDLAETIEKLTAEEKNALKILMGNENDDDTSVDTLLRNLRFSEKRVCPFCGRAHVVKNGTRKDGTQKYHC
ncbi:MAG: IS1595 family transposase, partial [Ruminococcus sp.]|nr:IS1595 family transposase [Ruminococcus sp.]